MEITISIIFRLLVIPIGLLIAFFSYRIYVLTKGGSNGWKYMAMSGLSFSFWAMSQIIFKYLIDSAVMRMSIGSFLFGIIIIFGPLSPIILARDLKLSEKARLMTMKRYIYYIIPLTAIIIAYNMIDPYFIILSEVISIFHVMLGLALITMSYALFFLWKETKNRAWLFIFSFIAIVTISVFMGVYSGNCCGANGEYSGSPVCSSYTNDYVTVTPVICTASILPITLQWNTFMIVGVLLGVVGFYLLWRPMNI